MSRVPMCNVGLEDTLWQHSGEKDSISFPTNCALVTQETQQYRASAASFVKQRTLN